MEQYKFKIGDKVICDTKPHKGKIGVITDIDIYEESDGFASGYGTISSRCYYLVVKFDDDTIYKSRDWNFIKCKD